MVSLSYLEPAVENNNDMTFLYTYQYKDLPITIGIGNIRLSYSDMDINHAISKKKEIMEESNYYPFGLKHQGYNSTIQGRDHQFGFGNKEEQSELGLEWIDIIARNYDPALGRWMNIDPLAEQMRRHSPYNYSFNSPLQFTDPDGMAPQWVPDVNGNLIAEEGDNATTLAAHLNISEEQATTILQDQGILNSNDTVVNSNETIMSGQVVDVDNNMTRAIERSGGITLSESSPFGNTNGTDSSCDAYICDQATTMANMGVEITPESASENGITGNNSFFDSRNYTEVESLDNVSFGQGAAVIGEGLNQHVVANYGQSKDGTQYVFSKAGRPFKPEVLPLETVMKQYKATTVRFYQRNE